MYFYERLKPIKSKIKRYFAFNAEISASTYAGGLAYFYFAGLVPFLGLVLSVLGALKIDGALLVSLFGGTFSAFLERATAESGNVGANILMATIAFYSSARFYFHLIRTGERVYATESSKGVIKRILSFVYLLLAQLLMVVAVFVHALSESILLFIGCSHSVVSLARFAVGVSFNLVLALALHLFAVPLGKKRIKYAGRGTLFTFVYWEIAAVVFDIYLSLKSTDEVSVAYVAAFLLYLYRLMRGLIGGMAVNALYLNDSANGMVG